MAGRVSSRRSIAGIALVAGAALMGLTACEQAGGDVAIDDDDIGGVVTGTRRTGGRRLGDRGDGTDLPTTLCNRIVVTDDRRSLLDSPTCPTRATTCGCAATAWWIRRSSHASPGRVTDDLTAVIGARPARTAAEYYPAGYWLSLLQHARSGPVPGDRRARGERYLAEHPESQAQWLLRLREVR